MPALTATPPGALPVPLLPRLAVSYAWAQAHRNEVELDKNGEQAGRYLYPVEHGQPRSAGVDYAARQKLAAVRAKVLR